ncbi:hypothetical protein PJP10_08325 [Mycobacterium kansasii]
MATLRVRSRKDGSAHTSVLFRDPRGRVVRAGPPVSRSLTRRTRARWARAVRRRRRRSSAEPVGAAVLARSSVPTRQQLQPVSLRGDLVQSLCA